MLFVQKVTILTTGGKAVAISSEGKKKIGMAAAVIITLLAGLLVFYKHWQFEMPGYPKSEAKRS